MTQTPYDTLDVHVQLGWKNCTYHRAAGGGLWFTKLPNGKRSHHRCKAFNHEVVIQSGVLQVPFLASRHYNHHMYDINHGYGLSLTDTHVSEYLRR